jgi:FG-GAP repeat
MKTRRLFIGLMAGMALALTLVLFLALDRHAYSPASAPLDALPDWIATGEGEASNFGCSVGTAGDVNGDGYGDVIVGADRYKQFTGRIYVYLGNASGLSATPIFTATGEDVNNHFGYSVATAGDVNGDGYDDIIVGAYHYEGFTGRVYVYAGNANGLGATPVFTITGEGPNIYFGRSVGGAGDVNGDGYDDVIVGAQAYDRWTGRVYVYAGSPSGLGATPIFTAGGQGPSDSFGRSVGTAGDVNGDGYSDVVVGAPGYGDFEGRIYVYAGSADGPGAVPMFAATGEQINGLFGTSAGAAGDVNRDGYDDIIVGAYHYRGFTGRVYVYAGSINGLSAAPIFAATGEGEHNHFGYSVSTAGDTNGDGYDDIIVGAYQYNNSTGRVYVYPGNANGLSITPILVATGEGPASSFGRSVGTAGDVNGKGRADLVIGACGYHDYTGRAYVYLGDGERLRSSRHSASSSWNGSIRTEVLIMTATFPPGLRNPQGIGQLRRVYRPRTKVHSSSGKRPAAVAVASHAHLSYTWLAGLDHAAAHEGRASHDKGQAVDPLRTRRSS